MVLSFLSDAFYRVLEGAFGGVVSNPLWLGLSLMVGAGTAFWWWFMGSAWKLKEYVDLNAQTRKWPDGSRTLANVDKDNLMSYNTESVKTLFDMIREGLRASNNGPMLGYRKLESDGTMPYHWLSFQQVINRSEDLAAGFTSLGIPPGQDTFITIYSKNRPEWIICEHAAYNNHSIIVPLYDTLGRDAVTYILQKTEANIVVCDTEEKANALLSYTSMCPSLKNIIVIEKYTDKLTALAKEKSVNVYSFAKVEEMGRNVSPRPVFKGPEPKELCTVCYTSGTTGMPKGAMLTHENVIASTTVFQMIINTTGQLSDVMMSFLPLAHMYERMVEASVIHLGVRIGFYRGDIRGLLDDIKELKPTLIPLVPRVLNRFYDQAMLEVNKSVFKKFLFDMAMRAKLSDFKRGIIRKDTLLDWLVFKRIRERFGGRVRLMMTGSAPIAQDVMMFARASLGCVVIEGYGQTECSAACSTSQEADFTSGHVGVPFPCSNLKLVDVPELGYFARNDEGEVWIRGKNVFQGYYKNEEQTKEALDDEGWLHSGDIGRWNPNGTLSIVDRKKNIFKLQQGEYIAPEKIENAYAHSELVLQSFVYGESLKNCLIGIVVPDEQQLRKLVSERLDLNLNSFEHLCRNPEVEKLVLSELTETGKKYGLHSFEQVKAIYLTSDRFTMENQLLTPTLKNKRPELKKHFFNELQKMYSQLK